MLEKSAWEECMRGQCATGLVYTGRYPKSFVVGVAVAYMDRRKYRGCSDVISNIPLSATYISSRADKTAGVQIRLRLRLMVASQAIIATPL
jgi:hypothetical protein